MVLGGDAFRCSRIPLADGNPENFARSLTTVFDWIEAVQEKGGVVLVHCFEGRSRSAALVIGYIMQFRNLSLRNALVELRIPLRERKGRLVFFP